MTNTNKTFSKDFINQIGQTLIDQKNVKISNEFKNYAKDYKSNEDKFQMKNIAKYQSFSKDFKNN